MSLDEGPDFNGISALQTLKERRDWLEQRVIAKKKVGWETTYDERERDALSWIISEYEEFMQDLKDDFQ